MADSTLQQAVPCTDADYEAMKWRGYLRAVVRGIASCRHGLYMNVDCGDVSLSLAIPLESFACRVSAGDAVFLHYRDGDNCLVAIPIWVSKDGMLPSTGVTLEGHCH